LAIKTNHEAFAEKAQKFRGSPHVSRSEPFENQSLHSVNENSKKASNKAIKEKRQLLKEV